MCPTTNVFHVTRAPGWTVVTWQTWSIATFIGKHLPFAIRSTWTQCFLSTVAIMPWWTWLSEHFAITVDWTVVTNWTWLTYESITIDDALEYIPLKKSSVKSLRLKEPSRGCEFKYIGLKEAMSWFLFSCSQLLYVLTYRHCWCSWSHAQQHDKVALLITNSHSYSWKTNIWK